MPKEFSFDEGVSSVENNIVDLNSKSDLNISQEEIIARSNLLTSIGKLCRYSCKSFEIIETDCERYSPFFNITN